MYDVSRWGRYGDPDEAAYWEFHTKRHGVGVEYTNEDFENDGSMGSQIIKQVRRSTAGQYSKDLAKLTIRGNKSNAAKGFYNGGPPPYGYRRMLCDADGTPLHEMAPGERKADKRHKIRLTLGPESEQRTVKRIFRLYTTHGYSIKGVVNQLNQDRQNGGEPAPRGGAWSVSTIQGILRNRTYTGAIVWNRRCFHHVIYPREIGKHHDPEEWIITPDSHPAIVSEEVFEEAQKNKKRYRNFRQPKPSSPYLLVGLIRCAKCGHNYQGIQKTRQKRGKKWHRRYYVCGAYQRKGKEECVSWSIPKEEIENKIIQQIHRRLKKKGALERIAEELEAELGRQASEPTERIQQLQTELEEIRDKEARLAKAVEDGMPYGVARERMEMLETRRGQILEEIAEWQEREQDNPSPTGALTETMAMLKNFREILDEGTPDEKRAFIQCFVDGIKVNPETGELEVEMRKVPAAVGIK